MRLPGRLAERDETPALLPGVPLAFGRRIARSALRRRWDVRLHDPEFVPRSGPVLLASNHVGYLDGPLLVGLTPRNVHAMVKLEMFEGPTGRMLEVMGQIPLNRFEVDPAAVKMAIRLLEAGRVVAIYPEGSRGPGDMRHIKRGVAYLAMVTGAPVVPVAVLGTRETGRSIGWVPPKGARVDLVYGEPIVVGAQQWPRRQHEVLALSRRLHEVLRRHVEDAVLRTGQALPGHAPDEDPPEPGSLTQGVPAQEERSDA